MNVNKCAMVRFFLLIVSFFAVSCMSNSKKQMSAAVYDEAALKDFVFATPDTNKDRSLKVMDTVLIDASKDSMVFCQTVAFLEKPFGDPNSAYKNDELYADLLHAKMKSPWTDSIAKVKARERLYLLMQNRQGTVANDFTYSTPAGFKKKMYDVHADFTLLFFYNPECPACKEM